MIDPDCEGCVPRLTAGPRRGEGHLSIRFHDEPFAVYLDGEYVSNEIVEAQAGEWGWVALIDRGADGGLILHERRHDLAPDCDCHFRTSIRFGRVAVSNRLPR